MRCLSPSCLLCLLRPWPPAGYLYQKYGDTNELWNSLDGIFACVIWDERTGGGGGGGLG